MPRGVKIIVIGEHASQYTCDECEYAASNKTGFRLHKRVTHGKDTKDLGLNTVFKCEMCKKKFDNTFQLKTHSRHTGHAATY
jgi:ribosomal protein L44E